MSIVPAGKRKPQISQGALKNESILDSVLFNKFGQGAGALLDSPPQQEVPDELRDTMGDSQSQLNMQDNIPGVDSGQQTQQAQQPQQPGMGSPASRFLGPDPDQDGMQTDPNMLWAEERKKIRSFVGNDFGVRLIQGDDGTFTVTLTPPGNAPVQDPTGFMDALLQHLGGGTVNEEDTPAASDAGGKLTLKYRPSGAGPEKIRPRGKGGRGRR